MSHVSRLQVSRLRPHLPLFLILLLFTILTLYYSIILPLGEADDETDHYQYLRFVARTGHPPFSEAERDAAGFKGGLAPLYYWLTAWPIALIGEDTLPDVRRVDARPERHIPSDGLGINHVLHTLDEQWPWRGQPLAWHLVRFLSLPMAWVTIIATYLLARRLCPEPKLIALGAAAFVAFLPRFVSSSAVINDDNLVFALTTLLLLVQVIILQNPSPSPRLFALFGALFGLALITKYFSLILIPEVIFTLVMVQVARRKSQKGRRPETENRQPPPKSPRTTHHALHPINDALRTTHYALRPFLLALFLTAGPWFAFIILRFNRIAELGPIPGLAASLGEPQITEGLVGLLAGHSVRPVAATYPLAEWLGLLYRSFWFEFGWMQIFAPAWIYGLFTVLLLLALTGHVLRIAYYVYPNTQYAIRNTLRIPPIPSLLTLHFTLFLIVVLARYILSATIDTGQGRHLYPALAVIALSVSLGLYYFGFWILDFGFKIFPLLAAQKAPTPSHIPSTPHHLPPSTLHPPPSTSPPPSSILHPPSSTLHPPSSTLHPPPSTLHPPPSTLHPPSSIFHLLSTIFFLLPAFILHPSSFILPHYNTLPITITPPADLPITYRQNLSFGDGLSLAGFDTPTSLSAGDALSVTLYWRAEQEAQQDFLISLCLQDDGTQPVGCWRGSFADGHYPARAWETGDTLAGTVFIPLPACYRLLDQTYHLQLEIWPLDSTSPQPMPGGPPLLQQTFDEPLITIQPTDSGRPARPQTLELWRGGHLLTDATAINPGETLTWLDYTNPIPDQTPPSIHQTGQPAAIWSPVPEFNTPLYLPCDDGPTPFALAATFIAGPTLPSGSYRPDNSDTLSDTILNLNLRQRTFTPVRSTFVFTPYLAPLSIEFPQQPSLNLNLETSTPPTLQPPNLPTFPLPILQPSNPLLPITIRWQARRWMPDPLIVSLKLLDKDFNVGGERLATLGDRYPNVLWAPTEIIEETYPLALKPDAPPGLYWLEVSLLHQDKNLPDGYEYLPLTDGETLLGHNFYPTPFRLLDPADGSPPPYPFSAQLGDAIHLTGYDLTPISNLQSPISLALYWQSTAPIPTDYTVFSQLIGPDGQVWAQWDNPPQAGRYPTTAWNNQDSVVDRYTLTLLEGAPSGQYRLLIGMYDPGNGQRLPATINGQPQSDNAIELTTLTINH